MHKAGWCHLHPTLQISQASAGCKHTSPKRVHVHTKARDQPLSDGCPPPQGAPQGPFQLCAHNYDVPFPEKVGMKERYSPAPAPQGDATVLQPHHHHHLLTSGLLQWNPKGTSWASFRNPQSCSPQTCLCTAQLTLPAQRLTHILDTDLLARARMCNFLDQP